MTHVPFLDVAAGLRELRDELDAAYREVLAGPTLVLGPQVEAFEAEFAAHVGARCCVGVGCGYDALVLALRAVGVRPGDDVLVPTNAYIADWLAVRAVGARPVGVEPRLTTHNLDPDLLDTAATDRTTAVLPVHLYGQPAEIDTILAWARRRGVAVVADAAQAHGARYGGTPVGAQGDAVAWSFYPTKNLGALGDGGAVTTDDPAVADRVRVLRGYGSPERDVTTELGVNSRLDELQAAFLPVKLRHLDVWNERRRRVAERYLTELAELPDVGLPEVAPGAMSVWHQVVLTVPQRDATRERLAARGVPTMVHYPTPPFAQPAFADLGADERTFPVAARLAREVLSLPGGPHLTVEAQAVVIDALREVLAG